MEVTSFEPALLLALQQRCPGLATDLLTPEPPPWMGRDVLVYQALHRARLARARAVHLHLSQVDEATVAAARAHGLDVHVWGVDTAAGLALARGLTIRKVCTEDVGAVAAARGGLSAIS